MCMVELNRECWRPAASMPNSSGAVAHISQHASAVLWAVGVGVAQPALEIEVSRRYTIHNAPPCHCQLLRGFQLTEAEELHMQRAGGARMVGGCTAHVRQPARRSWRAVVAATEGRNIQRQRGRHLAHQPHSLPLARLCTATAHGRHPADMFRWRRRGCQAASATTLRFRCNGRGPSCCWGVVAGGVRVAWCSRLVGRAHSADRRAAPEHGAGPCQGKAVAASAAAANAYDFLACHWDSNACRSDVRKRRQR